VSLVSGVGSLKLKFLEKTNRKRICGVVHTQKIIFFIMRKPEAILLLFLSAFTVIAFCQDASNDDGSNELNEVVVLLFLIVGLGIGIIVNQFLSIFGEYIPYTCLVFLLGLALSQAYKEDGISLWIILFVNKSHFC